MQKSAVSFKTVQKNKKLGEFYAEDVNIDLEEKPKIE